VGGNREVEALWAQAHMKPWGQFTFCTWGKFCRGRSVQCALVCQVDSDGGLDMQALCGLKVVCYPGTSVLLKSFPKAPTSSWETTVSGITTASSILLGEAQASSHLGV
jgi:hypothetical protein